MSQLTIKLSDKADALIAQLQKEIFNRRRKKVSAAGVVETLVESAAKSQSDKRFATSWKNLIADIERAAKLANAHGAKPANLSDQEWAMVLSHRNRKASDATAVKPAALRPKKKASGAKVSTRSRPSSTTVAKRMAKAVGRRSATSNPSGNGTAAAVSKPLATA